MKASKAALVVVAAAFAITTAAGTARAQGYPSGPVKVIVPFTAGSATDIMARTVGDKLSSALGKPVIVENHPGAGGTIGINLVAKAAPDGLTLGVVSTGHTVNHVLYKGLPYDTIKDFAGVSPLATLPSVLIAAPSLGVKTVRDLVALAKSKPGQLNYGTAGVGSAAHINQEKFNQATGIQAVHIPFKGTPEILNEAMAGRIEMAWVPLISSVGPIKDGKVVALAVSTPNRSETLPQVPTIKEAGYPGGEFNFWVGMLAPAKTPRDVVKRLNAEIAKAEQAPEVKARIAKLGAEPMPMSPERFDAFIKEQYEDLGKIMRAAGAKPQ
ncbi:MAG TPA: tripartite tricarboxylate transporter substrate binding protein [Burkholderiales bacterium]|nr:tripartite tricarboxylate transporter substrate binding protein [Burkholderiales bacterium]